MKDKRAPRNTAEEVRDNPLLGLMIAIGSGGSGILAQEADGQRSFVGSETLPTDMGQFRGINVKGILETAGVKFFGPVEDDKMFQYVELPQGWKKVPTDHSMWSKLVDYKGRERAAIFYKAAFYDRSAHMSLSCRFGVSFDYNLFDSEYIGVSSVTDGGKVIHTTKPIPRGDKKSYDVSNEANALAVKWLNKKYPDWQNPGAYWD